MSWAGLTYRDRALIYNTLRDVEEIAFKMSEYVRPGWVKMKAKVDLAEDKAWIRIDEMPVYLNMVDALFVVRDMLKLILEADEKEKIKAVAKWWVAEQEKKDGNGV